MKTLKQEEVAGLAYRDSSDARRRIASFIEDVYNRQRLHSALDYLTPEGGDCQEFCAVGRFHQLKNRSPKMTANCVFAS
ncbi:integrase core domain-containing protein, partial [Sinorhizobium medicae]|uniref:integrase core domain-containing protein n=1 Tax=Sinorhizobium medicae TaxID=110321 RepID=UPI0027DD2025